MPLEHQRPMTSAAATASTVDLGLRAYMLRVYNYMSLGVAFTGVIALMVAMNPNLMAALIGSPLKWVLFFGVLGVGWMAPSVIASKSLGAAQAVYWLYAGLWGAFLAPIFYIYTGTSIVRVFFITAAAFAGLSLYGYSTKRDLTAWGAFLSMSSIGILIALLVNMFILRSSGFHLMISIAAVVVFAAMTAYSTQTIKNSYYAGDSATLTSRKAIYGALELYGCFITLFIFLLSIFGRR